MADNYYDMAKRMCKSSETLHNNAEYHNSCYLAGYVVECYAKIIINLFSGQHHGGLKKFSHNISGLDAELQNLLSGNSTLSSYILSGSSDFASILNSWNPVIRYVDDTVAIHSIEISQNFQDEMLSAMQKLAEMKNDGYTLN